MKYAQGEPDESPSSKLAALLSVDENDGDLWTTAEMAAIWTHQLNAPLTGELRDGSPQAEQTIQMLASEKGRALQRFSDLLVVPNPPLEVLQSVKEFAKRNRQRKTLPVDIATGLYYLALGLTEKSSRKRISEMDDAAMVAGLTWLLAQPWLDELSRATATAAIDRLK